MELLGRNINVVPTAAGAGLSLKGASTVTFFLVGADTFTLTCADSFAGSYATPGNIIVRRFNNTVATGTAKWTKATQTASNAVVVASGITAISVDGNSLPDTKTYVKVTPSGSGTVIAVFGDLTTQRSPDLLAAIGA